MGLVHDSYGPNRIAVEERSESFYISPGYGYDEGGNEHSNRHGEFFGRHWRESENPEFLLEDVPHLIRALADLPTCPQSVKDALSGEGSR